MEKSALRALPLIAVEVPGDYVVVGDQGRPDHCCLLLSGFMYRYKTPPDGGRQILSFHLPGDVSDLQNIHLGTMDHSIGTLVPSRLGFIPQDALLKLSNEHAGIAAAFWRDTLIDAAVFREWIVNVGRRSPPQRVAHLLSEVNLRAHALGLASDGRFALPLSRQVLGDSTAMSKVQVSRVLHDFKVQGLLAVDANTVTVEDAAGLQKVALFDPTYLHLKARI